MHYKLLAELEKVIQDFADKHCEDDEWPDIYWPDNGSHLVTNAASLIIDAFTAEKNYIDSETQ